MTIKFSIITVVLNNVDTIERVIESVICQTYTGLEYIVIDGGSTDGTVDITERYKERISYYVSEPDEGIYYAMKKGLRQATGDYVIFMNGDDWFVDENVLSRIAPYCKGDNIVIGREYCGSRLSDAIDLNFVKSKYYDIFYPHQATFVPRWMFDAYGFFDEKYNTSADFEWICRAIHSGAKIDWVDEIVSNYSIGGRSYYLGCCEDEYLISQKYMILNNEDVLIPDMTAKSIKKARNTIFRSILADDEVISTVEKVIRQYFFYGDSVRIWGAGRISVLYIDMFKKIGVEVECIIDKNKSGANFHGIPVVKYDKELVRNLFISTEDYDEEITSFLIESGFEDGKDFISHEKLMNGVINEVGENYRLIREFKDRTGLSIFEV